MQCHLMKSYGARSNFKFQTPAHRLIHSASAFHDVEWNQIGTGDHSRLRTWMNVAVPGAFATTPIWAR